MRSRNAKNHTQSVTRSPLLKQSSTFLPVLRQPTPSNSSFKQKNHFRKMRFNSEPILDSETETLEYLNECERIIQNLKHLTKTGSKKITQKRIIFPTTQNDDFRSVNEHLLHKNELRNPQKRKESMAEQQILRIRIPEHPMSFSKKEKDRYPKIFDQNENQKEGKTKRAKSNKLQSYPGRDNSFKKKTQRQNDQRQRVEEKYKKEDQFHKYKQKSADPSFERNFDETNYFQAKQEQNQEGMGTKLSAEEERNRMEEQKQEKQKRKRVEIMKYLEEAKKRGVNLQEKIKRHKFNFKNKKKQQQEKQ